MNENLPSFGEFLSTQSIQIPVWSFVANLILTALLAFLLGRFYSRFGRSLANRTQFASNFILIAMTTMLIISIVKASLALSLGLVGALSIVRFRAAIKEPEELAYLFLNIAIGLGLGADQRLTTLAAFCIILTIMWFSSRSSAARQDGHLYLTIGTNGHKSTSLSEIIKTLEAHCSELELKRLDEDKHQLEAAFNIRFENISDLEASKSSLYKLDDSLRIALLDRQSIGGLH